MVLEQEEKETMGCRPAWDHRSLSTILSLEWETEGEQGRAGLSRGLWIREGASSLVPLKGSLWVCASLQGTVNSTPWPFTDPRTPGGGQVM